MLKFRTYTEVQSPFVTHEIAIQFLTEREIHWPAKWWRIKSEAEIHESTTEPPGRHLRETSTAKLASEEHSGNGIGSAAQASRGVVPEPESSRESQTNRVWLWGTQAAMPGSYCGEPSTQLPHSGVFSLLTCCKTTPSSGLWYQIVCIHLYCDVGHWSFVMLVHMMLRCFEGVSHKKWRTLGCPDKYNTTHTAPHFLFLRVCRIFTLAFSMYRVVIERQIWLRLDLFLRTLSGTSIICSHCLQRMERSPLLLSVDMNWLCYNILLIYSNRRTYWKAPLRLSVECWMQHLMPKLTSESAYCSNHYFPI